MPADLPTLQGRLDALKQNLASGTLSVSYGDYHATFRSTDDLLKAIKDVETDIALLGGSSPVTRTFRFRSRKDL